MSTREFFQCHYGNWSLFLCPSQRDWLHYFKKGALPFFDMTHTLVRMWW